MDEPLKAWHAAVFLVLYVAVDWFVRRKLDEHFPPRAVLS